MPKISVIVPVYNVEKYLHRCVDSILAQTFTDFELLLINDGSKDNSGAICDEYAAKDPRVRVFHKENGGVSSARNIGLENAKGEWITFVDSDDYVDSQLYTDCVEVIEENQIDIIKFGYYVHKENNEIIEVCADKYYELDNKEDFLIVNDSIFYFDMIWNAVFRKEVVGLLRFDEKISWSEDFIFSYEAYKCSEKMIVLPEMYYHYRETSLGLSNKINPEEIVQAIIKGYELKEEIVVSEAGVQRISKKYNYWLYKALHLIYTSRKYKREWRLKFLSNINFKKYEGQTLMQRFLITPYIPLSLKDLVMIILKYNDGRGLFQK